MEEDLCSFKILGNNAVSMCTEKRKQTFTFNKVNFNHSFSTMAFFLIDNRETKNSSHDDRCQPIKLKLENSRSVETKIYLPWWCMWSIAACISSTTSTVQAIELYSWWSNGASGMSNSRLALGPPNKATPVIENGNKILLAF